MEMESPPWLHQCVFQALIAASLSSSVLFSSLFMETKKGAAAVMALTGNQGTGGKLRILPLAKWVSEQNISSPKAALAEGQLWV